MKLMIVEDHAIMRRFIKSILLFEFKESVEIHEFDNGEEAVEQYTILNPDFVLMDIDLGGMDGFKTTELILQKNADAKIIFVSSNDGPEFRKRARKLNAAGFVSKEELSDLAKEIRKNI